MTWVQLVAPLITIAFLGYLVGIGIEAIFRSQRGPLCSCGHPAAKHAVSCSEEGCKCLNWKNPNRE